MSTILVTGGAGFIGANFVLSQLARPGVRIVTLDKLTYAGNLASLREALHHSGHRFVEGDISDVALVTSLLNEEIPDAIVHLAAETHVDRSIDDPAPFIRTNVVGTFVLLEATRNYLKGLPPARARNFRFVQVSTDEVYGSLGPQGYFSDASPYAPNSPYAASKAGADHMARAYFATYGVPVIITNCSNNFGPYQYPEKLIPLMILNALEGKLLPVYGDGGNIRDWLFVEDHCRAIERVLEAGLPGETYTIGGRNERSNLEVAEAICDLMDQLVPDSSHTPHHSLIGFVEDRPGHDRRYAIDPAKIERKLGWRASESFASGLEKTVLWYRSHLDWCEQVTRGGYQRERVGLEKAHSR